MLQDSRATKYTTAVRDCVASLGHATNTEILASLRHEFPGVSATTVHRVTNRLLERGDLQLAPSGSANLLRFDANLQPHDHFMCSTCGLLKDVSLQKDVRPLVERALGDGCTITGSLTVAGVCKGCRRAR